MSSASGRPAVFLLRRAVCELGVRLQGAFMVGHKRSDPDTGRGLG